MISWAVIVNSKENWIDFIPETPIDKSDPKRGLKRIKNFKKKRKTATFNKRCCMENSQFLVAL